MASKKSVEQAKMWLQNKIGEDPNSLDSINAGVTLSVLEGYERKIRELGWAISRMKNEKESGMIFGRRSAF